MGSLKKNFMFHSISQILQLLVPLITTPYVVRVLGVSCIGQYSYYFTLSNFFLAFTMLGLEYYGTRVIAENRDDANRLDTAFSEIYSLQLLLGIVVMLSYICYVRIFSSDIKLALVFCVNILSACVNVTWGLAGLECFKTMSLCTTVAKLSATVAIFVLVKDENDIILYCTIMVISSLLMNLFMWKEIVDNIRFIRPKVKNVIKHVKPNFILFLTVFSNTLYTTIDKLMLGVSEEGMVQLGAYELSTRIVHIPVIFVASLGMVMMPRISNLTKFNKSNSKDLILISAFFSAAIVSSMTLGIMGVSHEFIRLYYGAGYELCEVLYLVLLPVAIFAGLENVTKNQILLPLHMDNIILKAGYKAVIVNIILNLILIPRVGAIGAAWAMVFAEFTKCVAQLVAIRHVFDIQAIIKQFLVHVIIGSIMFIVIYPIEIFDEYIMLQMVIKILIGGIVYIMLEYMLCQFYKKCGNEYELAAVGMMCALAGKIHSEVKKVMGHTDKAKIC